MSRSDTIAAIATPPGPGAIAVLRLSGPKVQEILHSIFLPAKKAAGKSPAFADGASDAFVFCPRRLHHGYALDETGRRLDEVLAVYMPGPASATGEDAGEVHCHGGSGVTGALLEAAVSAGARPAGPGEFTLRAFLNGRMDLTQAEAVAELVNAKTPAGARLAAAKLGGSLGREIEKVRETLDAMRIQSILDLDFPEEDAELLSPAAFTQTLSLCRQSLERLLDAFARARFWREGASVVLCGRVNAGKSSLLNALLCRERAIVSEEAGTTRDYIEENLNIGGLALRLADTAGLRDLGDREIGRPKTEGRSGNDDKITRVEGEGIRRAHELARAADLILYLKDARDELVSEDVEFFLRHIDKLEQGKIIAILNKCDLIRAGAEDEPASGPNVEWNEGLAARCAAFRAWVMNAIGRVRPVDYPAGPNGPGPHYAPDTPKLRDSGNAPKIRAVAERDGGLENICPCLAISAKTGAGLAELLKVVQTALLAGRETEGDLAPNLRQSGLIRNALDELHALEDALKAGFARDALALHLESAARLLGEVSGKSAGEELLGRIFSSFCIGK
ncbi:MAG: tRNA uridine-5-carboxymethylaminomethyl(34) synthesis GTPase MnmE [Desulfovibrio sp.]|nr:tRNA uridine-5-carboxymethylaminomethyl(34) synthesis GTPase MnmE [Desulfovibrio sp.]